MTAKDFVVQKAATFDVANDGTRFRMNFICRDGGQVSLNLPAECLNELIMTLPRMMERALRARYHDESLRLVYPAEKIRIEHSSDPKTVIVTLVTQDGFEVSFGLTLQQLTAFQVAADAVERKGADIKTAIFN